MSVPESGGYRRHRHRSASGTGVIAGCLLGMVGGAAQVLADCIKKVRNVYFYEKFGAPEAIWEFEVEDFPAVVTIDAHGNSLHKEVFARSQAELAKHL